MKTYLMTCRKCGEEYTARHKFGGSFPSCPHCGGKNYPHVPFMIRGENRKDFTVANLKSRKEVATKVVDKGDIQEIT